MDPISIHAVTDHIIYLAYDRNIFLSASKLQKLLYFAQGWHLALSHGYPLVDDDFEGWKYGPVAPNIHHRFEELFSPSLTPLDIEDLYFQSIRKYKPFLSTEDQLHIELIFTTYGDLSGYQLEEAIKAQPPWKDSRLGMPPDEKGRCIMQKAVIHSYFAEMMNR